VIFTKGPRPKRITKLADSTKFKVYNLKRGIGIMRSRKTIFLSLATTAALLLAFLLMKLQGQGKLLVQDQISEYFDNCPDAWKSITIHDLLNQSSRLFTINIRANISLKIRFLDDLGLNRVL